MVTKMTKSIWVGCIALAASMFLTACSDESPFSKAEDDLDDIRDEANNDYDDKENEKVKCRYGESSHSDEWCCDYYGYQCSYDLSSSSYRSSSSSRNGSAYDDDVETFLYRDYSVEIDLTRFKQLSDNWDNYNKNQGVYSDADPSISFLIKTYADGNLKDSVITKAVDLGEDIGLWSGHEYFEKSFNAGANEIYICPIVKQKNFWRANVDHSSLFCYIISDAGKNVNKFIDQSDYRATDYALEWTVRISYN